MVDILQSAKTIKFIYYVGHYLTKTYYVCLNRNITFSLILWYDNIPQVDM